MMVRIIYLLLITLLSLVAPWWAIIPFIAYYAYSYVAFDLVVVMVLVDGYYGAFAYTPWLTIMTFGLVVLVEYCKPYIGGYTR